MKITISLILFTCFALMCSMRLKEKRNPISSISTDFNLLIFGDNGELDYFYKHAHKISKGLSKDEVEKKRKEWIVQNILAETYETEGYNCIVKKGEMSFDLIKNEGLTHFDNFNKNEEFKTLLKKAEKVVFLGDMIYPETKFLGTGGGDKPYVLDNKSKWVERLICSWNVFYHSLEKMQLSNITKEKINVEAKVDFIAGNHSFDIDIHEEENQIKIPSKINRIFNKKYKEILIGKVVNKTEKIFTVQPRFIRIEFKKFIIKFLDFNSGLLLCVHEKDEAAYNKCINGKFLPSSVSFNEARTYYMRLYGVLKYNFRTIDKPTVNYWNVMRAHHPPTNPEDRDEDFYFTPIEIDLTKDEKSGKHVSLFELMGQMNVHIFLGSHVHNAEVLSIHYKTSLIPRKDFDKKDIDKQWGCHEAPEKFDAKAEYKPSCSADFKRTLKFNEADPNQQILYIFITGNSGRNFDALRPSDVTNGYLIWSRATKNQANKFNYGFTFANFNHKRVAIDFYELDADENKLTKSASFSVEKGIDAPTNDAMEKIKATIQVKKTASGVEKLIDTATKDESEKVKATTQDKKIASGVEKLIDSATKDESEKVKATIQDKKIASGVEKLIDASTKDETEKVKATTQDKKTAKKFK